ncbi:hypothetical protein [Micromonospora sp. DH14]|uniref:hypothetical protein n=1 Tax=Micromonospora sp. DH14 TaxID=3040120 RepID=UPI0024418B45|nr:hypothetical protein [Micromonospora sp. DH14]MDG9675955.1 hypothetical protein [Micromonospora sp. DH14]
MAALVEHTELYVDVDYRLFAMIDDSNDRRDVPPSPHELDQWVSSTPGYVAVENIGIADAYRLPPGRRAAGPPGRRAAGPPGRRAAGPPGRRWSVRLAWRTEAPPAPDELPTASVLIQFSPA